MMQKARPWLQYLFENFSAEELSRGTTVMLPQRRRPADRRRKQIDMEPHPVSGTHIPRKRLADYETWGDKAPITKRQRALLYNFYRKQNYYNLRAMGAAPKTANTFRTADEETLKLLKKKYDLITKKIVDKLEAQARRKRKSFDREKVEKAVRWSVAKSSIKESEWRSYMEKKGYGVEPIRKIDRKMAKRQKQRSRRKPVHKPVHKPARKPARKPASRPVRRSQRPQRPASRPQRPQRRQRPQRPARRRNPTHIPAESYED